MGFLDGVRVVDATRLLPGGYCTMLLSDMGADVVKVEQPGLGDYMRSTPPTRAGRSPVHATANRNKRSIGIDLKTPKGKEVLRRLLLDADVFVEGFRPGVMRRLGFSFEQVRRVNPRVVYCSISAFGQRATESSMPGHDINFQAMAGALGYSAEPEVPMVQWGDMVSGLFSAVAIIAALRRGVAVHLDIPIVQSLLSSMVIPVSSYLATDVDPKPRQSLVFGSDAYYGLYRTSDGKHMAVAAIEEPFWRNLVRELGVPELADKRFGSLAQRREVRRSLASAFASRTRDEWARLLAGKDTCATPVLTIREALESAWGKSSKALTDAGGDVVLNSTLSSIGGKARRFTAAPELGSDTAEIMRSLGFGHAEIARMKRDGVVE